MNNTPLYDRIITAQYGYDGIVNDVIADNPYTREYVDSLLRVALTRYNRGDIYNAELFLNVAERIRD